MTRPSRIEVILLVLIGGVMFYAFRHPYARLGCDGWGEYRRQP